MLTKDMTKTEIEKEISAKGDYVKIDLLDRLLKEKQLPTDRRKFVYEKLSEIYENRGMLVESAKMHNNIAIASTPYSEKIVHHLKEAELYIKVGIFDFADEAVKKAIGESNNTKERENVSQSVKDFYKRQALVYEKERRRAQAIKIYEKLLQMSITSIERQEIKDKLSGLYEQTGRIKEYFALKK